MDLFVAQGYTATTIDQIAESAGLSKRSFFRYFASKEELIIVAQDALGDRLAEALADHTPRTATWDALRRALHVVADEIDAHPKRSIVLLRMLADTPELRAGQLEKHSRWRDKLALRLRESAPPPRDDLTPLALAGAAIACYQAAQTAWLADGAARRLGDRLDEAMRVVEALG
jgi:AcrR family transcriptional regulator